MSMFDFLVCGPRLVPNRRPEGGITRREADSLMREWRVAREEIRRLQRKMVERMGRPDPPGFRTFMDLKEDWHELERRLGRAAGRLWDSCPGCGLEHQHEYSHTEELVDGRVANFCMECTGTCRSCAQCGTFYRPGEPMWAHFRMVSKAPHGQAYIPDNEMCPECGHVGHFADGVVPAKRIDDSYGGRCPA